MPDSDRPGRTRPRDPIELQVQGIFAEVLQIGQVDIGKSFLELGGHSLAALQIQDRLSTDLGTEVSLDALVTAGSVAQLAGAVRRGPGAKDSKRLAALVPTPARTLYAVHSIVGTALRYRPLAHLLDRSGVQVRAFQARGLAAGAGPHDDLTAMAGEYVAELRRDRAGELPVLLLGYSLGALVAFEMARRLRATGVGVGHLFLLDTEAPVPAAEDGGLAGLTPAGRLGQSLDADFDLRVLDGVEPGDEAAFLLGYARAKARVPETYTVRDVARLLAVVRSHARALEGYTPPRGRLDVTATVFAAPREGAPPDLWWGELIGGELSSVEVPGPHHRLLDPPSIDVIARRVVGVATAGPVTAG